MLALIGLTERAWRGELWRFALRKLDQQTVIPSPRRHPMRVMVMVRATAASEAGQLPSTELLEAMNTYTEELQAAGILLAGEGLLPSSEGARVRFTGSEPIVSMGPFPRTDELVAGFWLWEVHSIEERIDWVKRCPNRMEDVSEIEIRPVAELEDFGETVTPELRERHERLGEAVRASR
jgi:hypothetical protein